MIGSCRISIDWIMRGASIIFCSSRGDISIRMELIVASPLSSSSWAFRLASMPTRSSQNAPSAFQGVGEHLGVGELQRPIRTANRVPAA